MIPESIFLGLDFWNCLNCYGFLEKIMKRFCGILGFSIFLFGVPMAYQGSIFQRHSYNLNNSNTISLNLECPIEENTYLIVSNTSNDEIENDYLPTQVFSSADVFTLLNHVNWRMFIYSHKQTCSNFSYSDYELQYDCFNSFYTFTDSIDDLFFFPLQCKNNTSCTSYLNSSIITQWYIFLLLGFIALVGNFIVIYDKIMNLRKNQNKDKEIRIYHTLVLNLAFADLLMGIYLTAISLEIKRKVDVNVYFSENGLCNVLAIINSVSSQVSITTLFIISFYRLVGVMKPFKKQHLKSVITVIIFTWIVWLVIAILPLIPLESFQTTFTVGLAKDYKYEKNSFIEYQYFVHILQRETIPSYTNTSEVTSVLHAVAQFPAPKVMEKLSIALGWVEFEKENWSTVGVYNYPYACLPSFFLSSEEYYRNLNNFKLTFVLYNLVVSVVISMFYVSVTMRLCTPNSLRLRQGKCCMFCRQNTMPSQERHDFKSTENRRMFKRISYIVLTDVAVWIPLCIAALVIWHVPQAEIYDLEEFFDYLIPLDIISLLVVPLNSILNPFLYSCYMWKSFFLNIKQTFSRHKSYPPTQTL